MSTETPVKSYHEDLNGLPPVDNQLALEKRKDYKNANWLRMEGLKEDQEDSWRGYSYLGFIPAALERALDKKSEQGAIKRATEHYKAHEGAYQEQAIKDAAKDGVHTTFGTQPK